MIGIFIGSFNPPTLAHLEIALLLQKELKKIVFVPVNSKEKKLVSLEKRIEMLLLLKRKYSFLEVDNIMKDYSYLNYRIINLLRKKYGEITLIIGSDLLESLDKYDNYQYLLENYTFLVIPRSNQSVEKMIHEKFLDYQKKFKIINYKSDISSSKVRELIKLKKDYKELLDKDVYLYLKTHQIYF